MEIIHGSAHAWQLYQLFWMSSGKGNLNWTFIWPVGMSLWGICLKSMINMGKLRLLWTMPPPCPRQVVLSCIGKQVEKHMGRGNNPVSKQLRQPPMLLLQFLLPSPCLEFPHWLLALVDYKLYCEKKETLFSPNGFVVFYCVRRKTSKDGSAAQLWVPSVPESIANAGHGSTRGRWAQVEAQ